MESRKDLFLRIVTRIGAGRLSVVDPRDGWPGIADLDTDTGSVRLALHVGPVGSSHRGRDDVERRFQNPGKGRPMMAPAGALPLLIGIWEEAGRAVLVGMEADQRLGRGTRQSLFIPLVLLRQTLSDGWCQHFSTSDELIVGFLPSLFPAYVEMRRLQAPVTADRVVSIVEASGLVLGEDEASAERARRAVTNLVRKSSFGRKVVEAYDGLCAMCGINLGVVQGAHIYPVGAPGSNDEPWNGMALCGNHHSAFDRHHIWIEPGSLRIELDPRLQKDAGRSPASAAFVDSTVKQLRLPEDPSLAPKVEMLEKRYSYFEPKYDWADGIR